MYKTLARRIDFEISEIDLFLETHSHLLAKAEDKKASSTETLALAALLHAFYNAVDNVLLLITKQTDGRTPEGMHRHRTLLDSASKPHTHRSAIISEAVKTSLKPYLGFHNFFRDSSSFDFDRKKSARLAEDLFLVWESLKLDLRLFVKNTETDPVPDRTME